jgi:hypothetical protein
MFCYTEAHCDNLVEAYQIRCRYQVPPTCGCASDLLIASCLERAGSLRRKESRPKKPRTVWYYLPRYPLPLWYP